MPKKMFSYINTHIATLVFRRRKTKHYDSPIETTITYDMSCSHCDNDVVDTLGFSSRLLVPDD